MTRGENKWAASGPLDSRFASGYSLLSTINEDGADLPKLTNGASGFPNIDNASNTGSGAQKRIRAASEGIYIIVSVAATVWKLLYIVYILYL